MGATETVTLVFTDLVGSTELLSRLGPEAAEVLRREHFGLLRSSLAENHGTEVKNTGDGMMAGVVPGTGGKAAPPALLPVTAFGRYLKRGILQGKSKCLMLNVRSNLAALPGKRRI